MKTKKIARIPYVPQIEAKPDQSNIKAVRDCYNWLRKGGFILKGKEPFAISVDEHRTSPSIGVAFEVLRRIESCGNAPNGKEHCELLTPGIYMTVSQDSTGPSGIYSTFRRYRDTENISNTGECDVVLCVGYNIHSLSGSAIMAWKNNIKLIKRTQDRRD